MGMVSSLPSIVSTSTEKPVKACGKSCRVHFFHVFSSASCARTHHLQRDLDLVDQVVVLPDVQRVTLLSHDENNIGGNLVRSLGGKYKLRPRLVVFLIIWEHWNRSVDEACWWKSSSSHDLWLFSFFYQKQILLTKLGVTLLPATFMHLFDHKYSTVDVFGGVPWISPDLLLWGKWPLCLLSTQASHLCAGFCPWYWIRIHLHQ